MIKEANVREMRRSYDKAVKLPSEFVAAFAKAKSEALLSWQKARLNSDFECIPATIGNSHRHDERKNSLLWRPR